MKNRNWYKIVNQSPECAEVMIYGQIGDWNVNAKSFMADLSAITAKNITVRINSVGGDVFDGCAIANAIKNHSATVNVQIDGVAASIASVVAIAGDTVCIAKNAFMMIHNASNLCFGTAEDMRKQADTLDKLNLSLAQAYVDKTGKPLAEIQKCMADETWFDAAEAKAFGLVDQIAGDDEEEDDDEIVDSAAAVNAVLKYKNAPQKLKTLVAALATGKPPEKKESSMANKVTQRDGKSFVTIDGKEIEIEVPANPVAQIAAATLQPLPGKTEEDVNKALELGRKQEREYRAMFNTIVDTAKLTGEAAKNFETEFYGRPEADLKFLASHAIGKRATAVGDSGVKEGEGTAAKPDPDAAIVEEATKRFNAEASLRQAWGVHSYDAVGGEVYKSGLARYVARMKQWDADAKAGKHLASSPAAK